MTLPATLALMTAVVALLMTVLSWGLSAAPGWRDLRWFSGASLGAVLFAAGNVSLTLPVSEPLLRVSCQLVFLGGALFVYCWAGFGPFLERRPVGRVDRLLRGGSVLVAGMVPLPGVLLEEHILSQVLGFDWTGKVLYREVVSTPLGNFSFLFFFAAVVVFGLRLLRASSGAPRLRGHAVALLALAGCIFNDTLIALSLHDGPYLLTLGFQAVVIASGTLISRRVGAEARALVHASTSLAEAQAALIRQERLAALGEVAAGVAHEVRQPLKVLGASVATLRCRLGDEPLERQLVEISAEETGRIERIVSELSEFAQPRAPLFERCPLEVVVETATRAASWGARVEETAVVLEWQEPVEGTCDAGLVHQAVVNLVTNALQARNRQRPVTVRLLRLETPPRACIEIQDDGEGLSPAQQERIFEPFFTTRAMGTGLGLSLVRRVAEVHGGTIRVDSAPGRGATFRLELPLERPADQAVAESPRPGRVA